MPRRCCRWRAAAKADGTAVVSGGGGSAATQSEQESASSTSVFVSPGRQQYHPSALKFWAEVSTNGTSLNVNYNVSGITDTGAGNLTVTIGTDFSSSNWACFMNAGTLFDGNSSITQGIYQSGKAAGSVVLRCKAGNASDTDPNVAWSVGGAGDQ